MRCSQRVQVAWLVEPGNIYTGGLSFASMSLPTSDLDTLYTKAAFNAQYVRTWAY